MSTRHLSIGFLPQTVGEKQNVFWLKFDDDQPAVMNPDLGTPCAIWE
jgi:hypothetical protein